MKTINYETIKSNLMVALENTGTDGFTSEMIGKLFEDNFLDSLLKSDDEKGLTEWFQALGLNGDILSRSLGAVISIGFFDILLHENYVDSGSDDYVYTYKIEQTEWPAVASHKVFLFGDWKEEWNNNGLLDLTTGRYYSKFDDKIHELQETDSVEHFYPRTNCVDWSEHMFADKEVAVYYCSKNNEIYECNVGDTIADQHA